MSLRGDVPRPGSAPSLVQTYAVRGVRRHGAPDGTIIVEADSAEALWRRLLTVLSSPGAERWQLLGVCPRSHPEAGSEALTIHPTLPQALPLAPGDDAGRLGPILRHVKGGRVAFLPAGAVFSPPRWDDLPGGSDSLLVWVPEVALPKLEWQEQDFYAEGWITTVCLLRSLGGLELSALRKPLQLAAAAERAGRRVLWGSPRAGATPVGIAPAAQAGRALGRDSTTLALVPHYRCEEWLGECLESLVTQSHALTGIAVIDDGSARPPVEIVRRFPQVTLLAAERNVGAYRVMQALIDSTDYDAYLFQDADDWSSHNRLELLLSGAEQSGAEWVGCQELSVMCDGAEVLPVCYPLDVNAALAGQPGGYCLLNGTSLVSGRLVRRLGGFATGLRFAADMELLERAAYVARVVNIPHFCYFRRYRAGSTTLAPETGHGSPIREELSRLLSERARSNAERARAGAGPDLAPLAVADPVRLIHVLGPRLRAN